MWKHEGRIYLLRGRHDCTVWECSLYDVCLEREGDTGLMVTEGKCFEGDGCYRTDTLRSNAVSETTL